MKKILFLITSLGGGGAERVLVNLVNSLDETEYDISVQTLFNVEKNRKYLKPSIKYIPGFFFQFPGNTHFFKLFSPKLLYKLYIKEDYDIIVSFLEGPSARVVSGCNNKKTKLISWIHVEQKNSKRASRSFRSFKEAVECYAKFDKIICVSKRVKEDFVSIFSFKKNISVVYNLNDIDAIKKLSCEINDDVKFSKYLNIVSIGRLVEQKGYDRLIKVHKRLLENGVNNHIYILGEGENRKLLEKEINKLGINDTFHLLGYKDNPYKYIKNADFFICSSRREGFSTAITESLILGIPVVSTNCSGAYELLGENNEYGIVTENSEEGIYEGIMKMIEDPESIKYYKKQALNRGRDIEMNNNIEKIEKIFKQLMECDS